MNLDQMSDHQNTGGLNGNSAQTMEQGQSRSSAQEFNHQEKIILKSSLRKGQPYLLFPTTVEVEDEEQFVTKGHVEKWLHAHDIFLEKPLKKVKSASYWQAFVEQDTFDKLASMEKDDNALFWPIFKTDLLMPPAESNKKILIITGLAPGKPTINGNTLLQQVKTLITKTWKLTLGRDEVQINFTTDGLSRIARFEVNDLNDQRLMELSAAAWYIFGDSIRLYQATSDYNSIYKKERLSTLILYGLASGTKALQLDGLRQELGAQHVKIPGFRDKAGICHPGTKAHLYFSTREAATEWADKCVVTGTLQFYPRFLQDSEGKYYQYCHSCGSPGHSIQGCKQHQAKQAKRQEVVTALLTNQLNKKQESRLVAKLNSEIALGVNRIPNNLAAYQIARHKGVCLPAARIDSTDKVDGDIVTWAKVVTGNAGNSDSTNTKAGSTTALGQSSKLAPKQQDARPKPLAILKETSTDVIPGPSKEVAELMNQVAQLKQHVDQVVEVRLAKMESAITQLRTQFSSDIQGLTTIMSTLAQTIEQLGLSGDIAQATLLTNYTGASSSSAGGNKTKKQKTSSSPNRTAMDVDSHSPSLGSPRAGGSQ